MAEQVELEQRKQEFIDKLEEMTNAAFELSTMWENGDLADVLHGSNAILTAYREIIDISFDEWVHGLITFRDTVRDVLKPKPRTVIAHLNIRLQAGDERTVAEVEKMINEILYRGTDQAATKPNEIELTYAEEI